MASVRNHHAADGQIRIFHSPTSKSQRLFGHAKEVIPGGTQLLSKRPEMFAPDVWPAYFSRASGCHVTDLDDNEYLDMTTMGVGACLLGYNDPDVTQAVISRVQSGSMCTLNCPDEVELADALLQIHPWADRVRYARTGGEAMTIAVRLARAATDRSLIAFCGYHGWHDWYLSANLTNDMAADSLRGHLLPGLSARGIPKELAGTAIGFKFNEPEELLEIVRQHGSQLAAVVMEPTRSELPDPGFLETVRELCDSCGAVLVFDEITSAWRFAFGGVHQRFGIPPDIAVFAKALGNGHPMAAVIGRAAIMDYAQESFISSTYWTEGVGPAAALATIAKMEKCGVSKHVRSIGERFQAGVLTLARSHNLPVRVTGHPALCSIIFDHPDNLALQTLLTVRALRRGILAGSAFYPSLAHQPAHVDQYLTLLDEIFYEVAQAIECNDATHRVASHVKHSGFMRLA